jgi:hypothetical protein
MEFVFVCFMTGLKLTRLSAKWISRTTLEDVPLATWTINMAEPLLIIADV